MTEQMAPGLEFEAMRRAVEESDYDALVALYADDAELRTVNKKSPPSSPQVLRGKEEISEMLRDVCGRAMTHHVEDEIVGENRVAFNEACEYPDGLKVLTATTLELQNGKISRQVNIEDCIPLALSRSIVLALEWTIFECCSDVVRNSALRTS